MIDKQVQDLAWKCLPKEIREHLKCVYKSEYVSDRGYQPTRIMELLLSLFGHHNLTSDAEPEEMLIVPRNKVQEKWQRAYEQEAKYSKAEQNPTTREELYYNRGIMSVIDTLFGSKCLPDEPSSKQGNDEPKFKYSVGQKVILHFYGGEVSTITEAFNDGGVWNKYKVKMLPTRVWNENELDPYEEPKPAEPKFKVGDKVRYKEFVGTVYQIEETDYVIRNLADGKLIGWLKESDLEPYTEPTNEDFVTLGVESAEYLRKSLEESDYRNLSQEAANCDKHFDNILKDSFSKERRLNIAAMVMQGIMANPSPQMVEMDAHRVADLAILMADTLIDECEKGDKK